MGKNEYKLLDKNNVTAYLRPGRHQCNCQARVHKLIRNCLGCGRIVCAQEGSGPCFYCGRLVCTREQRKIIEKKDKESLALLRKLWNDPNIRSVDSVPIDLSTPAPASTSSLTALGKGIEAANVYKQKLLKADRDREVTRVNDLQQDYYSLENNPYLTEPEREAIVKRKDELRQLQLQAKKNILVEVDVSSGEMQEQKQQPIETVHDPVIRSILEGSTARNAQTQNEGPKGEGEEGATLIDTFHPKYEPKGTTGVGTREKSKNEDGGMIRSARQRPFCVALKQSFASKLLRQAEEDSDRICFIPWRQCISHRGPVLITSLGDHDPVELFNGDPSDYEKVDSLDELPRRAILGKGHLQDCITWEEFNHEYSSTPSFRPLRNSFVLLLSDVEDLPAPIPCACPSEFFELDQSLVSVVNSALLSGGEMFDATDAAFMVCK